MPATPKATANPANPSFAASATKQSAAESGTSVAPRQRPKASQSQQAATGLGTTLPIMLPPSPSPRTVLSSPVPTQINQSMGPPAAPVSSATSAAVTPAAATVNSMENAAADFNAQFTAVFPSATTVTTTTTTPGGNGGTGVAVGQQQMTSDGTVVSGGLQLQQGGGSEKHLNNLFETNYPDPFREQHPQQQQFFEVEPRSLGHAGVASAGDVGGMMPPGSGAGTPTKGPMNSLAAGHQHRRNVSDTSAFNK